MLEAESDALKLEIRQQAALEAESDALKLEICQQAANIEYLEDCLREIRFIAIGAIRHPDIG
jgi:hypothetical protein